MRIIESSLWGKKRLKYSVEMYKEFLIRKMII